MKRTKSFETDDTVSSTESGSWIENTPGRTSDHEIETSTSVSVTPEEVARQIRAVTDPFSQQLAHLCELMRELKNEQANRRHEQTTFSRIASRLTAAGGLTLT